MDSYNCCAFSVNSSNTLKILHVTIMEEFTKLEKQLSKVKKGDTSEKIGATELVCEEYLTATSKLQPISYSQKL